MNWDICPCPPRTPPPCSRSSPAATRKDQSVLTTNRSVAAWGDIFSDSTIAAAMLDRLLHRSVVFPITGDSYRLPRLPSTGTKTPTERRRQLDSPTHPGWGISTDRLWGISVIAIISAPERLRGSQTGVLSGGRILPQ